MNVLNTYDNARAALMAAWYLRHATQVGDKVRLWGRLSIRNHGKLIIGARVRLVSTLAPIELVVAASAALEIEESTYINYGCSIGVQKLVRIGPHCAMGNYCVIMDNNYHRREPERRDEMPDSAPVILEENVWLGVRVVVLPGVTIGSGSVIGAGSVVTRSIPARTFAAGVPAKVIKSLD